MDVGGKFYYWPVNNSSISPPISFGGIASFHLSDNLNLTGTYLYGYGNVDKEKFYYIADLTDKFCFIADIVFAYKLGKYFYIYSGIKYMSVNLDVTTQWASGPSAGLNVHSPVWKNFFLVGDISFFCLTHGGVAYGRPGFDVSLSVNWEWEQLLTLAIGTRYLNVTAQNTDAYRYVNDFKYTTYGIFASATLLLRI
jgi:hypothetical protein